MKVVLGGRLENALFRDITSVTSPEHLNTSHPYYISLYRQSGKRHSDRFATFAAISSKILLPVVDWNVRGHRQAPAPSEWGVFESGCLFNEWDVDVEIFVGLLLARRVFSHKVYAALKDVGVHDNASDNRRKLEHGLGTVNGFAFHHLCRLIQQIRVASDLGVHLVLGDEERGAIREIGEIAYHEKLPLPTELPDLRNLETIDGGNLAGGLLNFSPPDPKSIIAVRKDKEVQRYAKAIEPYLVVPSGLHSQRGMVNAMRKALERSEDARKVQTVFEISSWVGHALHYIPVVGHFFGGIQALTEIGQKWATRDQKRQEWFLLGPKMSEISIRDYIRRTGNL